MRIYLHDLFRIIFQREYALCCKITFQQKKHGYCNRKNFRETNFHKFREFWTFSQKFVSTFPFAKVTPVKIFWFFRPFSYQLKFLKKHFLVQSHYSFCIFPRILNVIPKNKSRYFRLRYLNRVLEICDVVKHELRVTSWKLKSTS